MTRYVKRVRAPYPDFDGTQHCAGEDPDRFVPEGRARRGVWLNAVCKECPFLTPCREFAVDHPDIAGWWGGTTESQREGIRRRRRAKEKEQAGERVA